ncbi:MAG: HAD family hydrolase [Treponema sp.]|nr:HAD family hydrolase [Treponema sp.]
MKKAVCFDLFWTLISPVFQESDTEFQAVELSRNDFESVFEESVFCRRRNVGEFETKRAIVDEYEKLCGLHFTDVQKDNVVRCRSRRMELCQTNIDPKAILMLKKLKKMGFVISLISNADNFDYENWDKSPLKDYFDYVTFSGIVKSVKPDETIYLAALKKMGLDASDCLFVGDGGHDELLGAKKLGFTTVFTECLLKKDEKTRLHIMESADFVIDEFEKLCEIAKNA